LTNHLDSQDDPDDQYVQDRQDSEHRERELVATLFELGREVSSVLDLDELLQRIPRLIARLTTFTVFAVYLLDDREEMLRIAYAEGYPDEVVRSFRLRVGEGIVGTAVAEQRPILVSDVADEPRFRGLVGGVKGQLAVPLRHKNRVIGALNLLSDRAGAFTSRDEDILAQFGVHIAQAIANAHLYEQERSHVATLETLTEIAREVAGILDLNELLSRIGVLARRVIDFRTFGILLVNEQTNQLEPKVALQYGEKISMLTLKVGEGLVGYAAQHKEVVRVDDVSTDPRYIPVVDDVRSELVIPLLVKDRCVGVFDLESPELAAFTERHADILRILASQTAVAIENAKLYETVSEAEQRLEREIEFARRVQMALLPSALPRRQRGVEVAARFEPASQIGGELYDFLSPEPHTLVVAVGDVSGKGVPAALYGAFVAELVRSRTFRRRFTSVRSNPAGVLESMNTILHERRLEAYFCTLCYALFDLKRRQLTIANSGLPYVIRRTGGVSTEIDLPGVPLGALPSTVYEERVYDLHEGDLYVFYSDGISEPTDAQHREFGTKRIIAAIDELHQESPHRIVDGLFEAVQRFRGYGPPLDDMTAVAVRITK